METVRVDVCYRPLRICWGIAGGDFAAFRQAVRLNHTMWGGRFNPIAVVDRADEARRIVEVFRADVIIPLGDAPAVAAFPNQFPHLINPFFPRQLFLRDPQRDAQAHVLDIQNALIQLRDTSEWKTIMDRGIRLFDWDADDPLADVLLMVLGAYPDKNEAPIDYRSMLKEAGAAAEQRLDRQNPIPADIFEHPSIGYFSRRGLRRHYGVQSNWDYPGFYLGDVANQHDLVTYWNLRATDTSLLFVDRAYIQRCAAIIPEWTKTTTNLLAGRRFDFQRKLAIWRRREVIPSDHEVDIAGLKTIFGEEPFTICPVDIFSWNGLNLQAPMMILGRSSQMGLLDTGGDKPLRDIERLKTIADALPKDRFEVYVLLAKLNPFTAGEIATAGTLNGPHLRRVILLTAAELEPRRIYERVREELKAHARAGSAAHLADMTAAQYFQVQQPIGAPPSAPG